MRLGTTANLPQGATYDLLLVQFTSGYPEGRLVFDVGLTPRKITGIQKVAQVFVKLLLTRKGDDPVNVNMGTLFIDYTQVANRMGTDQEVYNSIVDQINDAVQQAKYVLNVSTNDASSQMQGVTIQGLETTKDSLTLYLKLTTMSGDGAAVAIPFPQLDMALSPNG